VPEYLKSLFQMCCAGLVVAEMRVACALEGAGFVFGLVRVAGRGERIVVQGEGLCGVAGGGDLVGVAAVSYNGDASNNLQTPAARRVRIRDTILGAEIPHHRGGYRNREAMA
jgi:hypothetical protein